MKLTALAFLLSASAAFAGPTENITGCATAQADNSNFTVRIDPTCSLSSDQSDGSPILAQYAAALWVTINTPDEDE